MNKTLSSVDLVALVSEFQILVRAKIQQIYHPSKTEFCLHFHVPGKGKQLIRIIAGKMINLTTEKRSSLNPSGLSMLLRKHISGAVVEKVWQKESERIIVFDIAAKKEKYHLVVELFSKGNVLLCDEKWKIVALQSWQLHGERSVKMKEVYTFPAAQFDWQNASEKEFAKLLSLSEKKNLVTSLAIEVGLGGVFATELCLRSEVDGKVLANDLSNEEVKKLFLTLDEMKTEVISGGAYVYANEISPIFLKQLKVGELIEEKESLSSAFDLVDPLVKISPYQKKIAKVNNIILKQTEVIMNIDEGIATNTLKGEKIYENYTDIAKLQAAVVSMSKEKSWEEIKTELEALKKVVSVDLRKKTVVLEL